MQKVKTSVSNADSYEAIGEFWDAHDLGEFWETTRPAQFQVLIENQRNYFPVETDLTQQLRAVAARDGIAVEVLVNSWLKERLAAEVSA